MSSASLGVVELVTLVDTSGLLTSGSKTTSLTVLVNRVGDPVVSSIVSDGSVLRIEKNDLKVLVSGVLVNPVRVKDTEVRSTATNTLFSSSTQRTLVLKLVYTLVGRLTVSGTLGNRSLTVTSADTDTVDDESLLGLVTETTSLIGTRRTRSTVNDVQLTVLPASNSEEESEDIRLLLAVKLFKIFVGTHYQTC